MAAAVIVAVDEMTTTPGSGSMTVTSTMIRDRSDGTRRQASCALLSATKARADFTYCITAFILMVCWWVSDPFFMLDRLHSFQPKRYHEIAIEVNVMVNTLGRTRSVTCWVQVILLPSTTPEGTKVLPRQQVEYTLPLRYSPSISNHCGASEVSKLKHCLRTTNDVLKTF